MARKTNQEKSLNNYFSKNIGNSNRIISVNKDIEDFGKNNGDYDIDENDKGDWYDIDSSGKKRKNNKKRKLIIILGDGKQAIKRKNRIISMVFEKKRRYRNGRIK